MVRRVGGQDPGPARGERVDGLHDPGMRTGIEVVEPVADLIDDHPPRTVIDAVKNPRLFSRPPSLIPR